MGDHLLAGLLDFGGRDLSRRKKFAGRESTGSFYAGVSHAPISPLTSEAQKVLNEIRTDKKSGAIVANLHGLVFTLKDGTPITRSLIHYQVKKAIRQTGVKKFTFHNLRNTALTEWARRGIAVDVAMMASGHSSVQMHKRYLDLKPADIANAFGTSQIDKRIDKQKRVARRK